jgi:hypothetical protein
LTPDLYTHHYNLANKQIMIAEGPGYPKNIVAKTPEGGGDGFDYEPIV